jgi:hypothetical protein
MHVIKSVKTNCLRICSVNRISSLPALAISAVTDIDAARRHSGKQQNSSKSISRLTAKPYFVNIFMLKVARPFIALVTKTGIQVT